MGRASPTRGIEDSLAGIVIGTGETVTITDTANDPRVPPGSPLHAGMHGAYLAHPVRDKDGVTLGVCCAYDRKPRQWTADEVAAVAEAAHVSTLLITEQLSRHQIDQQRRFLDAVLDSLHDGGDRVRRRRADRAGQRADAAALWGGTGLREAELLDGLTDSAGKPIGHDELGLFRALGGEHLRDEEVIRTAPGGKSRHYLLDAHPITGPGGRTIGAVQGVQDVTRRKRVERFRMCELAVATALAEASSIEEAGPPVLEAVVGTLDWAHAELWLVDDAAGVVRPGGPGGVHRPARPDSTYPPTFLTGRACPAGPGR